MHKIFVHYVLTSMELYGKINCPKSISTYYEPSVYSRLQKVALCFFRRWIKTACGRIACMTMSLLGTGGTVLCDITRGIIGMIRDL